MSYQAYLDAIEVKTGKTPQQLLDEAASRGYGPQTKAAMVVDWLQEEYGVGRGHALAALRRTQERSHRPREARGFLGQSSRRVPHLALGRRRGPVILT
jgi:hypothetical protein